MCELGVGPCIAPIVRGVNVQGMTHISKQCLNRVARNIPCIVLLNESLLPRIAHAPGRFSFAQEPLALLARLP